MTTATESNTATIAEIVVTSPATLIAAMQTLQARWQTEDASLHLDLEVVIEKSQREEACRASLCIDYDGEVPTDAYILIA